MPLVTVGVYGFTREGFLAALRSAGVRLLLVSEALGLIYAGLVARAREQAPS